MFNPIARTGHLLSRLGKAISFRRRDASAKGRRILVVDDDEVALRTWRRVLRDADASMHLVTARGLAETRALLEDPSFVPIHAALIDCFLGDGCGLELVGMLRARCPAARLALVSAYMDADIALRAQGQGLLVLPKPLRAQTLRKLVGVLTASPSMCAQIRAYYPDLSAREAEVLGLAVAGLDNKAIASRLGLAQSTVETYWQRISDKTGVRSRRELVGAVAQWLCSRLDYQ